MAFFTNPVGRSACVATLALVASLTAAPAWACRILRYDLIFGANDTHWMQTGANEACSVSPTDGWRGNNAPAVNVTGIRIASRPKFGIAGTNGTSFYAYKPNPGFVGKDSFVVTLVGTSEASRGSSNITVDVTVGP